MFGSFLRSVCSAALTAALVLPASAQSRYQQIGLANQTAPPIYIQNGVAPASLQVNGTISRMNVSAARADVQDALKLIFQQAGKQFMLDNDVSGQVTLLLINQPFTTILNGVCRQTFLTYRVDPTTGIYTFSRDAQAVKNAFARLHELDALLWQQLRLMGLTVPEEVQQAGGFGGVGRMLGQSARNLRGGNSGIQGLQGPGGPTDSTGRGRDYGTRGEKANPIKGASPVKPEDHEGSGARPSGDSQMALRASATPLNNEAYSQVLAQNSMVAFSSQEPLPIVDILRKVAGDANVPIVIDPSVPQGKVFTLKGTIPARSLTEMLNLLAPPARLEWRWVGNSIFVNTTPEFQVFYGEQTQPKAVYPPNAKPQKLDAPTEAKKTVPKESGKAGKDKKG